MTEKQINILNVALELFAEEGFASISTSKIAKKAGVSEGLIFRHFENKEGLLAAVLERGYEKAEELYSAAFDSEDPREVIRLTIEMPQKGLQNDEHFWRLTFRMKWQGSGYEANKAEPLKEKIEWAFSTLNYENPKSETDLLLLYLDGMVTRLLIHKNLNAENLVDLLKSTYDV